MGREHNGENETKLQVSKALGRGALLGVLLAEERVVHREAGKGPSEQASAAQPGSGVITWRRKRHWCGFPNVLSLSTVPTERGPLAKYAVSSKRFGTDPPISLYESHANTSLPPALG